MRVHFWPNLTRHEGVLVSIALACIALVQCSADLFNMQLFDKQTILWYFYQSYRR